VIGRRLKCGRFPHTIDMGLLRWFIVDIAFVGGTSHCVLERIVSDFSEVHIASIFKEGIRCQRPYM
jgi:hypothetical protein